ncbi:MAG: sulfatase-like hydrolase/transferase [Acidobacteria bacterium]|nr:sulfatase-like hydrolase/transferase [Acidobacteriota bacterium]
MSRRAPGKIRRWQATLIVFAFMIAVASAAVIGWWYARESAPHQGPIVLVSVDGQTPGTGQAAAGSSATPSIDALTADAVVFDRAYTHSPLTLPAQASLLSGQLPFEHGARGEAGFAMDDNVRSLAELLRNRGFETGAAVSSFLLRPESGLSQGFSFFDLDLPETASGETPVVEREGGETAEVATGWMNARNGYRYFLFVQVNDDAAEAAVGQLVAELKERGLYDQATILLTSDHGGTSGGFSLGEESLHVPLIVKQPDMEGAGRHVTVPVQHIDVLPTILDLVRAPVPSGLRGRSLRGLLDGDATTLPDQPMYAESLGGQLRLGTAARYALFDSRFRYLRGDREELVPLETESETTSPSDPADEITRWRTALDRLLDGRALLTAPYVPEADVDRFAALGFLGGGPFIGATAALLTAGEEAAVSQVHRAAARLVAQRKYAEAIDQLRSITREHPDLAAVRYQTATVLLRAGRIPEAEKTLQSVTALDPDNTYVQVALADALLREGREEDAEASAALAIALAEHQDDSARAAAHRVATLVALAREDEERAGEYAASAERDDPTIPMSTFVEGREAYSAGRYEDALAAFEKTSQALAQNRRTLESVYWYLGDTLARLGREADAEKAFRDELRAFPRHISGYTSLATLYHASGRAEAIKETLDDLVSTVPTPEGYDAAARVWLSVGDPTSAAALRTDARARFRGDPSLAFFQRRR